MINDTSTKIAYTILNTAIGISRLWEMRVSRNNKKMLMQQGIDTNPIPEPGFLWIVLLHTGILAGSTIEVWLFNRPFSPITGGISLFGLACATMLRRWVIETMGSQWNVRIVNSISLGVVTDGPFQWVRHPNYTAVSLEIISIPLIHNAWITAFFGSIIHIVTMRNRIKLEEETLFKEPRYQEAMGDKPRFLPSIRLKRN